MTADAGGTLLGPLAPSAPVSLVAEGLTLERGGRRVLDAVSFALEAGRHLAILGPNGAGKSSLLAILSGQLTPSAGRVLVDGRPLAAASPGERARLVAFLPQASAPSPELEVRALVALARTPWLGLFAAPGARDRAIVDAALARAGVAELARRRVGTLSGGERQRVALAHVLAQTAPLVLFDEPTTHLDLVHQLELEGVLAERGRTRVSVLHDPALARRVADVALCLDGGRVVAAGPTDAVVVPEVLARTFGVEVDAHGPGGGVFTYRSRAR